MGKMYFRQRGQNVGRKARAAVTAGTFGAAPEVLLSRRGEVREIRSNEIGKT